MILTGKAKKDFHNWINNNGHHDEVIYNSVINALIIEWLDSVYIYVETYVISDDGIINYSFNISGYEIVDHKFSYPTRQQATEKAIIKAIDIYNNRGN